MNRLISRSYFKLSGWRYDVRPELWSNKQVVVGFPHTTNMDGVRVLMMFMAEKIECSAMIKKELFKGPMGWLLNTLGCIPVDRHSSKNLVTQMAEVFNSRDRFTLVLAPEGTRAKKGHKKSIKTGFWHIAKAANVPIIMMMSDSKTKRGIFLGKLVPSDDIDNDLEEIKALYLAEGLDITA